MLNFVGEGNKTHGTVSTESFMTLNCNKRNTYGDTEEIFFSPEQKSFRTTLKHKP